MFFFSMCGIQYSLDTLSSQGFLTSSEGGLWILLFTVQYPIFSRNLVFFRFLTSSDRRLWILLFNVWCLTFSSHPVFIFSSPRPVSLSTFLLKCPPVRCETCREILAALASPSTSPTLLPRSWYGCRPARGT